MLATARSSTLATYPLLGYSPLTAAIDLNKDGHTNALLVGGLSSLAVSVFYGRGDGTLADAWTLRQQIGQRLAERLDDDGTLNLITANSQPNTISILPRAPAIARSDHGSTMVAPPLQTVWWQPTSMVMV